MEVRLFNSEMERNKRLQHQLADLTMESLMKEWAKGQGEQKRKEIKCESHGVETEGRDNEGSKQNWFPSEKVN